MRVCGAGRFIWANKEGGDAVVLLHVDGVIGEEVLSRQTPHEPIKQARPLVCKTGHKLQI
jgi:hypothetical protein